MFNNNFIRNFSLFENDLIIFGYPTFHSEGSWVTFFFSFDCCNFEYVNIEQCLFRNMWFLSRRAKSCIVVIVLWVTKDNFLWICIFESYLFWYIWLYFRVENVLLSVFMRFDIVFLLLLFCCYFILFLPLLLFFSLHSF